MLPRRDPLQLVGPQHDVVGAELLVGDLHQGDVDRADVDEPGEFDGAVDHELDDGVRMRPLEPPEEVGDSRRVDLLVRSELDPARQLGAVEPPDGTVVELDDHPGVIEQGAAVAGRSQRVAVADEEWSPDALLEPFDLPADGGLRDAEPIGGTGHATGVEHGEVGPERFDVELQIGHITV